MYLPFFQELRMPHDTQYEPIPTPLAPAIMPALPSQGDLSRYPEATQRFLKKNKAMSTRFCSTESVLARSLWLLQHAFRVTVERCIDGREGDAAMRMNIPEGLAEMYCSGGCKHNSLASPVYKDRVVRMNKRYEKTLVRHRDSNTTHPMAEMRFVVAHHSSHLPLEHSCAAWNHQTDVALRHLRHHHVDHLNQAFQGSMVAILALADTATDALTLYGPEGMVCASAFLPLPPEQRHHAIEKRVRECFPLSWPPIANLAQTRWRDAFYPELVEHLLANVAYVERVKREARPVELLTHHERLLYIGRPLEMESKEVFCIEDREPEVNEAQVRIGLPFVAANNIRDALACGTTHFHIPIVIGIPHDSTESSRRTEQIYARQIWHGNHGNLRGLRAFIHEERETLADKTLDLLGGLLEDENLVLPLAMENALGGLLVSNLNACICVADRRTRFLVPLHP